MRRMALFVSLIVIMSSTVAAWGPTDPSDKKADPDGDKLGNLDEFRAGTNPLNPDSDLGGCQDGWEVSYGLDPTNPADDLFDTDNDGWTNLREFLEGTDPTNPNTDNDGYPLDSTDPNPLIPDDYDPTNWLPPPFKVKKEDHPVIDSDNDSIPDDYEPHIGTDPYNKDSDGDHLFDGSELRVGSDPNDPDTDDDGLLDGQEQPNGPGDSHYTGTCPTKSDSDGDGILDGADDTDMDGIPNWAEWRYDEDTGLPINWTLPRDPDTDDDGVGDGAEVHGNPRNKGQTSNPLLPDTDGDWLTDDIDPRTWVPDMLPFSRIRGYTEDDNSTPWFPQIVSKGIPFNIEGRVEYNNTEYTGEGTGHWLPIKVRMVIQVWVEQDGRRVAISDPVVTGAYGQFKVTCTIGDDIRAGETRLVITTGIYEEVAYRPVVWDDLSGNNLP